MWIGRLDSSSVAAWVLSSSVWCCLFRTLGLIWGAGAVIARYIGRRDREGATHATRQGTDHMSSLLIIGSAWRCSVCHNDTRSIWYRRSNYRPNISLFTHPVCGFICTSLLDLILITLWVSGDFIKSVIITLIFLTVHLVLSRTLLFGYGFSRIWALTGRPTAEVISSGIGTIIGLWFLMSSRSRVKLSFTHSILIPG